MFLCSPYYWICILAESPCTGQVPFSTPGLFQKHLCDLLTRKIILLLFHKIHWCTSLEHSKSRNIWNCMIGSKVTAILTDCVDFAYRRLIGIFLLNKIFGMIVWGPWLKVFWVPSKTPIKFVFFFFLLLSHFFFGTK